jgi:hypothetical protein
LKDSLNFYRKLNFEVISQNSPTLVTDGQALIEINPDRYARGGIKLFKESWSDEITELTKLTAVIPSEECNIISDPSGTWIYLMEGKLKSAFKPQEKCFGLTGNFSGLSLETTDINQSLHLYEILGFKKVAGDLEHGWISLSNNNFAISIMRPLSCPHLFFNPSMTYFNGKENRTVIQNIRNAGVPITEEITQFNKEGIVDNIIIRDPGGLGFFIFND